MVDIRDAVVIGGGSQEVKIVFFGLRARNEGKKVEQNLSNAKQTLRHRPNESIEDQVKRLQEDLIEMCDANIALRKQLGAMTAL